MEKVLKTDQIFKFSQFLLKTFPSTFLNNIKFQLELDALLYNYYLLYNYL